MAWPKKKTPVSQQEKTASRHIYPTPKQQFALDNPADIIIFGGSRGGGKSACSYMKCLQHATLYGRNAKMLFLRKTLRELEQNIDEAKRFFMGTGEWKEQKKRWEFKNGAVCNFDYVDMTKVDSYQGHEYTLLIYDELGNFDSIEAFDKMRGNMRSAAGVPIQIFATCNPGGILHNIIKQRYIDPAPEGFVPVEERDDNGNGLGTYFVYIPSTILDNPHLLKNDPNYMNRLKQVGSPEMVRAWLLGDWNVIAGGAFDKLWDSEIHVMRPFRVPESWRKVGVYDDGLSKPWCYSIFAFSDGSDYILPNGAVRHTIRGDMFVVAEWYGWNGKRNQGTCENVESKAEKIKSLENAHHYKIKERIADNAIFTKNSYKSIANTFEELGLYFEPCKKAPGSRINSMNLFRNRLMGALERKDSPGIFWFSNCHNHIATIPTLPRDKKNMDDIDTAAEDHCLDTILYGLLAESSGGMCIGSIGTAL